VLTARPDTRPATFVSMVEELNALKPEQCSNLSSHHHHHHLWSSQATSQLPQVILFASCCLLVSLYVGA
ncbi:hypothetical protein OFM81_29000, partial [Escherichia coli]|nr:hypothetical protein [Escherichia coli]